MPLPPPRATPTPNTAPSQWSAVVNFPATATDNCPGVTVACVPASGSSFGTGTNTVTCTATDAAGNTASCNFKVTVNDIEVPVITCPVGIVTNTAHGQCSAVVNFTATATDNCPGVTVVCVPASGSSFAKGTNGVTCTATDAAGNTASCNFNVGRTGDERILGILYPHLEISNGGVARGDRRPARKPHQSFCQSLT